MHVFFCQRRIQRRRELTLKAAQAKATLDSYRKEVPPNRKLDTGQIRRYNCTMCERTYSRSSNLKRHVASHRPVDQWNHKCGICHRIFDKLLDLKKHFRLARCAGNGVVTETGKAEEAKGDDTTTPEVTQTALDRLLYVCSTCNKQFKTYSSLKVHENVHTGLKVFICETCGKRFGGQMNLTQHRLTHVNTKQYACKLCSKVFKRSGGLSQHVKSFHMNIKPYQCPVCRRDFALKADMVRCRHSKLKDL